MTTLESLRLAILVDPSNNVLRGAYADALDEAAGRETSYGRFIRNQLEYAYMKAGGGEPVGDTIPEVEAGWKRYYGHLYEIEKKIRNDWDALDGGDRISSVFYDQLPRTWWNILPRSMAKDSPSYGLPFALVDCGFVSEVFVELNGAIEMVDLERTVLAVAHQPVTSIQVGGREPDLDVSNGLLAPNAELSVWQSTTDPRDLAEADSVLPKSLFDCLPETGIFRWVTHDDEEEVTYQTQAAANKALADACLRWCRLEAVRKKLVPNLWGIAPAQPLWRRRR